RQIEFDRRRSQQAVPAVQRAKTTPNAARAARITKRARNFGGVHGTDTASFRGRPRRRGCVPCRDVPVTGTGGRHHPGTTGGFTRNQHVKAVGGGHETNFDHDSAPRRTRTDAARGLWLRVRGGSCATKRSSSAIGINVRPPSRNRMKLFGLKQFEKTSL